MQPLDRSISPRTLARALGLGEATIKRWVDRGCIAAARTEGGHRRILLADATRFIRERGLAVVEPSALQLGSPVDGPAALADVLCSCAVDRAAEMIECLYRAGVSASALCDDWIGPAMHGLGQAWSAGEIDVTYEHEATAQVGRAVGRLLADRRVGCEQPLAVVAALSGDLHGLPCLCAELVLRDLDFRVRNFGASTPAEDLVQRLAVERPSLLVLSFSLRHGSLHEASLAPLRRIAAELPCPTVIGGRGCTETLRAALGAAVWCRSMRELEGFARHLALQTNLVLPSQYADDTPLDAVERAD